MTAESKMMKRHHVQWAAQFQVAAELCKRACDVSFTMGNATPIADLLVMPKSGDCFSVDVKGQSTKNFWRIREKPPVNNLYYVLCYVAPLGQESRYVIIPQSTLSGLMSDYETSGVKFDPKHSGINWGTAFPHEGRWDELPI